MSNISDILKSFHLQNDLNPKIWDNNSGTPKMNPKVRTRLLEIVNDFMEFLNVDIIFSDITMTGSLANYNWSKFSDVDIHILADFGQFSDEEKPLYDELFKLKKTVYNNKHNITIFGYDVELYVEDETKKKDVKNVGVYSILTNEWISEPTKNSVDINYERISNKAEQWMKSIDMVVDNTEDEEIETAKNIIKKFTDKIRKYRESGLVKGGEYSEENLVFKILRRNGYLEKIKKLKDKLVDNRLSLKERKEQMIKK
jgi:predicted nucleotidyltransferase